jgi:hypothetical protein
MSATAERKLVTALFCDLVEALLGPPEGSARP